MSETIANNGDMFVVRDDEAESGVMIDKYLCKTSRKTKVPNTADSFMIVPIECVREVGEALVAWSDANKPPNKPLLEADDVCGICGGYGTLYNEQDEEICCPNPACASDETEAEGGGA